MLTHYLFIKGCANPGYHGDGWCDDVNNNEACLFDGGDCCGGVIDPSYCTECICLEEGGGVSGGKTTTSGTTTSGGCNQGMIGNNYCDDVNNNESCFFDGGDCCGPNVNTNVCTECQCLEGGEEGSGGGITTTSGTTATCYYWLSCNQGMILWIGDGYCDDVNNNEACCFDGGDCCGGIIDPSYCTECICLEEGGGITTTSGTTTSWLGCDQGVILWIADGYCDDINNNLACTYDGGDCCGHSYELGYIPVNTDYCTECLCLEE